MNTLSQERDTFEGENSALLKENVDFRDKIEALETLMNEAKSDICVDWLDMWKEVTNTITHHHEDVEVGNVANNIVKINQENRKLKSWVEHLEIANMNLTNQFEYKGNLEPTRTLINW
jgi:hypothetical protein